MVGSERETVTRAIDQLEHAGSLRREDHRDRLNVPLEAFDG
jgi:DNA-binding GntR family transcriptional regulator